MISFIVNDNKGAAIIPLATSVGKSALLFPLASLDALLSDMHPRSSGLWSTTGDWPRIFEDVCFLGE